jgi:acylphosphatase
VVLILAIRYFGTAAGRVQGVGFRMFVQQHAMDLHVTGWIRNMED